jgi:hypothetical protein
MQSGGTGVSRRQEENLLCGQALTWLGIEEHFQLAWGSTLVLFQNVCEDISKRQGTEPVLAKAFCFHAKLPKSNAEHVPLHSGFLDLRLKHFREALK